MIEIKLTETFKPSFITAVSDLKAENDQAFLRYSGKALPYIDDVKLLNYKDYLLL